MDRTALIGAWGTFATLSGNLHEWIGVVAGVFTIVFMSIKILETLRKK